MRQAMIVSDHSLEPLEPRTPGRKLWRLSWMEMDDYEEAFRLENIIGTDAGYLLSIAELEGLPIVLVGARVASYFSHDAPPFEWRSGPSWIPMVRIHEIGGNGKNIDSARAEAALRGALYRGAWPTFDVVAGDMPLPCGVRVEKHPEHPRHAHLRIACAGDVKVVGRVMMPWGRTL